MTLPLAAFAAFFVVALIYLYVLDRIRVAISLRHPETFRQLVDSGLSRGRQPMSTILSSFVWKRGDKALGDRQLTALTRAGLVLGWLACLIWLALLVSIFATPR